MLPWANDTRIFIDRSYAGKELAKRLAKYAEDDPVVLALPRGGVPVGFEISKVLHAPLDVIVARKIGLPGNKEFGIGAIGENNVQILDERIMKLLDIRHGVLEKTITDEQEELQRRVKLYRNRKMPNLKNKTAILVDDGVATGVTAKAAMETVKTLHPKKIIFASPVCSIETAEKLRTLADEVICLVTPTNLRAIGEWYQSFEQVEDWQVLDLLKKAREFGYRGYGKQSLI